MEWSSYRQPVRRFRHPGDLGRHTEQAVFVNIHSVDVSLTIGWMKGAIGVRFRSSAAFDDGARDR
jgi:hypothetical protein